MTSSKSTARFAGTCLAAALCLSPAVHAADGEGWDWVVAPYGWAPSISTDLNTSVPPNGTDTEFPDIIDKIDGAFLLHVEGQGDTFGVFGDVIYLGLGDRKNHPRYSAESDLDTRLFEAALVWSPGKDRFHGGDLFAGVRYIDIDLTMRVDPVDPAFASATVDAGESFTDFMVGARYAWKLGERWGMNVRADTSFGDTDGTWSVAATVLYRMKRGEWAFGYRHMDIAFEPRDNRAELILSGPIIGYGFNF